MKRIFFVLPPFALPTTPPLGIAQLKAFIKDRYPSMEVKCHDLNLRFHLDLVKEHGDDGNAGDALSAMWHFSGNQVPDPFADKGIYHRLAGNLMVKLRRYHDRCRDDCIQFLQHQEAGDTIATLQRYVDELLEAQPDCIGLSVLFPEQFFTALTVARLLKKKQGEVPILLGGSYIDNAIQVQLEGFPEIDGVIVGEGELFMDRFLRKGAIADLKTGDDLLVDPDMIGTPDFTDFDIHAYLLPRPCLPIVTARGCPWRKCAFCVHHKSYGMTYRRRSLHLVMQELTHHIKRGIRYFSFVDEMIPPERFRRLAGAILEAGLDIDYYALAKPDLNFTADDCRLMAQSGCRMILWGLESASERILKRMKKGIDIKAAAEVFRRASSAGIRNHLFIIVGFPTETVSDLSKTLAFLYENRQQIDSIHHSRFFLNRGSPIFERPNEYAISKICDAKNLKDWYDYETQSGFSQETARHYLQTLGPFFSSFNAFSPFLNNFRDHALMVYARYGDGYDILRSERKIRPAKI